MNSSRNDFYYTAMRAYTEDDFTKEIVEPLFKAMGYNRVEFHGGPNERGRDLIASCKMPPPVKDEYVVYVQSKKLNKNNKLNKIEFDRLVTQMRQACEVPFVCLDGRELKPNQLYISTPNLITQRFLDDVKYNLHANDRDKVEPLDCVRLVELIEEHCPKLLEKLEPFEEKLWSSSNRKLPDGNNELLGALCSQREQVDVSHFYSDLSFFVGDVDSRILINFEANLTKKVIKLSREESWSRLKNDRERISNLIGFDIFTSSPERIEYKYHELLAKFKSKENKQKILSLASTREHIQGITEDFEATFSLSIDRLKQLARTESSGKLEREELSEIISTLVSTKNKIKNNPNNHNAYDIKIDSSLNFNETTKTAIKTSNDNLKQWASSFKSNREHIEQLEGEIINEPFYMVELNSNNFEVEINNRIQEYHHCISILNSKSRPNLAVIKDMLDKVEISLKFFETLYSKDTPLKGAFELIPTSNKSDRVSISAHDVFYTRKNIAVYGGAGVGKTTTLEMFSKSYNEELTGKKLIFCSLNRVVQKLSTLGITKSKNSSTKDSDLDNFITAIILLSYNLEVNCNNKERLREHFNKGITLIFDGLDEIISEYPIVLDAMNSLRNRHPKIQWIISSRDCVSYLDQIDFLGITLLPFTKDQLRNFIYGWFEEKSKAEKLWNDICEMEMHENLLTPLVSTILCTLVEKGVKAPSNENEIYEERMSLLLGKYDDSKKIKRQIQSQDELRTCAKSLALYMHTQGIRTIYPSEALSSLNNALASRYDKKMISRCLKELEDPCNVLIRDKVSNTLSFGHFRFQEHLAAMELKTNRSIDLEPIIVEDWWRGAFCLYAQSTNDVESTIDEITKGHQEIPTNAYTTLYAMCDVISKKKGKEMKKLLDHLGRPYGEYLDVDSYSYEYDEFY